MVPRLLFGACIAGIPIMAALEAYIAAGVLMAIVFSGLLVISLSPRKLHRLDPILGVAYVAGSLFTILRLPSIGIYGGMVFALTGLAALIPRIRRRAQMRYFAPAMFACAAILIFGAFSLPVHEQVITTPESRLDEFAPRFQYREFHELRIEAQPAKVYRAACDLTPGEIRTLIPLMQIRGWFGKTQQNLATFRPDEPLIDVSLRTGFIQLAEEAGEELVLGAIVMRLPGAQDPIANTPETFKALKAPGYAKAVIGYRVHSDGASGSIIITETRVFATDVEAQRRFTRYWRLIFPGSALIRRSMLEAIRRRAEKS